MNHFSLKRGFYWVRFKIDDPKCWSIGYCDSDGYEEPRWTVIGLGTIVKTDKLIVGDFIAEQYSDVCKPTTSLISDPNYQKTY